MLRRSGDGFTLIEVMVALVVVALGMMAVKKTLSDYAATSAYLEEKTLASWIATNELTEIAVGPTWPALGDYEEDVEFARRQWRCEVVVSETEVENLRRADVSVALADRPERVIHTVSGLIEPPIPDGFPPLNWISVGRGGGPRG